MEVKDGAAVAVSAAELLGFYGYWRGPVINGGDAAHLGR